ncbi:hypothetical protein [Streptomyces sp. NPDC058457]|uniref:hypothetical protein n=1 Tax=Streptomyces sp. NPDC058457 TaxID=3346507 RepID=UPI00365C5A88
MRCGSVECASADLQRCGEQVVAHVAVVGQLAALPLATRKLTITAGRAVDQVISR